MVTDRTLFSLEFARRLYDFGGSEFSLWVVQFTVVSVFTIAVEGKAAVWASKP
jgi:hypothetical protein